MSFGINAATYEMWRGNTVDTGTLSLKAFGCTFVPNQLSEQDLKLTKADKAEMRKWGKKSRKALLLEMVRLQKQCHKNWEIAEERQRNYQLRNDQHKSEILAASARLESEILAASARLEGVMLVVTKQAAIAAGDDK